MKKSRVILRILTLKDVTKKYVSWLNDYETMKFTEQKYLKHTLNSTINYVKKTKKSNNQILYGIYIKNKFNFNHVGNIKLGPINYNHKSSEISYFIGEKNFLKKGVGTEAIRKIIQIAKSKYKLSKLIAGTYSNNISSQRVLIKNNFIREANFKSQLMFEGKRINHYWYGLKI